MQQTHDAQKTVEQQAERLHDQQETIERQAELIRRLTARREDAA